MIIASDTYDCFLVKATFESGLPTPASMTVRGKGREQRRGAERQQSRCQESPDKSRRPNACSKWRGSKEWKLPLEDRGIPQFNQ